ncbi:MAG: sigma-54 dependent transcriptional regulator [Bacteroidales bacterium]|nr:sigma-54 dependent transcriptional regulator [Bacteroidales bacterium]MCF8390101.1 sigma-54 dependent transcriptional regulator [Bacteroidales bacterium]
MNIQQIKQRFNIIGSYYGLDHAINIAMQVAATDLTVLITGESGTGKEVFPQIIHSLSARKHNGYIAVNCGAIPEGTIDSELFGHEKGSFTGAHEARKGYFEVADGGTIFLDEVAELPLSTQVRLLRVLESGEFMRVGSSKVQKTNIRMVAATNVNVLEAIRNNKFREDLYYRLNTVPITVPALRKRGPDISLLFRKFASDFAETYRMPAIVLTEDAKFKLENYSWPGNIRQLKNLTEQISVIEPERTIDGEKLVKYLPDHNKSNLPAVIEGKIDKETFSSEREILYKILFDMKNDMTDLKKLVHSLMSESQDSSEVRKNNAHLIEKLYEERETTESPESAKNFQFTRPRDEEISDTEEIVEESLSLASKEIELIKKALLKYNGKRKNAAIELGISERTLYRKIKEYNIDS